jgi:hypothetical protein
MMTESYMNGEELMSLDPLRTYSFARQVLASEFQSKSGGFVGTVDEIVTDFQATGGNQQRKKSRS